MQNLDQTAEELFNKIRGRFPSVTIGDAEGNVTNEPTQARYFDFNFVNEGRPVGKISISLDNKSVAVVYGEDLVANETDLTKSNWYDFLKELRMFARKRAMTFDTRDITKSNLNTRDYKFLATNRDGEDKMNESKLYGTSRVSYQNFDGARIMIKHTESVNQELAAGRTQKIGAIYIESADGERFKYPYKHLTGARAMARHVAEGGKPFDDFGIHITGLSEELNKLRKFKTYMGRSAVMAESLAGYMDVVKERIAVVKKTVESLQKANYYKEAFEGFETAVMEDVPEDVKSNWIDELTIKQFNEELADVFPYIYKLVSEATKVKDLSLDDIVAEVAGPKDCWDGYKKDGTQKGTGKNAGKRVNKCVPEDAELEQGLNSLMGQFGEEEVEEGFDPESLSGEMDYEFTGDDGETGYGSISYQANVVDGQPVIDPLSLRAHCNGDGNNKLTDEWCAEMVAPGGSEHDAAMEAAHEDATEVWQERDVDVPMGEEQVDEAYINTSNDAVEVLANLRKIGKSIERGQGEYEGNLANMYANDTWDVYSFIEARTNNFQDVDKNAKAAIDAMMDLRKEAKGMEREPGSGKNGQFGNQIVNTLYPVMEYLYTTKFDRNAKEGNAYSGAVAKAKMNGKKKGDKIDGPDGDEITLEKEQKTPLGEFILSYFDRETGEFPKGETAILTMVEKDYGDQFINPAKAFIERLHQVVEQYRKPEVSPEFERMRELAGLR